MEFRFREVYIKIEPATIVTVIYVLEILVGYTAENNILNLV